MRSMAVAYEVAMTRNLKNFDRKIAARISSFTHAAGNRQF
jgi:hypothetical protein